MTTLLSSAVAFGLFPHFELSNLVMVYLLGVTVAGLRFGRGPAVLTAVLNVAAFDFFFVAPRFTFAVGDAQYLVTFCVMLTVALVIANLVASVRQQTRVAGARERRTALLYAMSRELAATRGISSMARVAVRHVAEVFQSPAVILLPDPNGKLAYPRDRPMEKSFRSADLAVAQWVVDHARQAGLGTDTLSAATGLYLPLGDEQQRLGVLAVLPSNPRRVLLPEQRHLLETFAGQIGLALERARLAEAAEAAGLAAERESLRNTLLASISHDLRTPLSVIAGAGSTLATYGATLDEDTRAQLARSIETKAREVSELVSNVLDLTRFESGQVILRRDWQSLDDLVGTALQRLEAKLAGHPVDLRIPANLPPIYVDAALIVQVFANLFDNVAKYTPAGTHVAVSAVADGAFIRVLVEDDGPGLPAGDPARLFDKFHRGGEEGSVVGVGLGLAICQAIVRAHGGHIEAQQRADARRAFRADAALHGAGGMTQATHQILVIEDEPAIRNVLRVLLGGEGYKLIEADTAARAEIEARSHKPDLLLVDLGLPDADGLTVIRRVRAWSPVPIIVLSARAMEEQKIAALDAGADDYIAKPFSAPELLARVRAGLRRNARGLGADARSEARRHAGRSRATPGARPQGEIHLTPLEFKVLECLARQTGMVVRQRQLLREVWGPDRQDDARSLRVTIKYLRDKLEPDPRRPRYLLTETGLGYRLCTDDTAP